MHNYKHIVEQVRAKYPKGKMDDKTNGLYILDVAQTIGADMESGKAGLHLKKDANSALLPDGTRVNKQLILFENGRMFDTLGNKDTTSTAQWLDQGVTSFFPNRMKEIYYDVSSIKIPDGNGEDNGDGDENGENPLNIFRQLEENLKQIRDDQTKLMEGQAKIMNYIQRLIGEIEMIKSSEVQGDNRFLGKITFKLITPKKDIDV